MPFSITPDPSYLYMSPRHQEALGHLLYGTGQFGGFVQLTGEVGTGKTTIIRTLLEQKLPDVELAMVLNPRQNEQEFVASICDELHVAYPRNASLKELVDALNAHLLEAHARGRRTVVIIDEAQNLMPTVLEQVRLLTNLETHKEKLLRIMLVGQPELGELLARADLRQLAQRITARFHLTPLTEGETGEYIRHRLRVAGASDALFTPAAIRAVHRFSHGVPRLVNVVCDRALMGAYGRGQRQVTPELVDAAAREVTGAPAAGRRARSAWIDGAIAAAIVAALTVWFWPRLAALHPSGDAEAEAATDADAPADAAALPNEPAPPQQTSASLEHLLKTTEPLPTVLGRLVKLWNADPQPAEGEPLCRALSRENLECYRASGAWKDLELADRPAILTLSTGRGGKQYVLLSGAANGVAVVEAATGPLRLDQDQLDLLWNGEYLLLWRRETPAYIAPDAAGPPVLWLRRKLEAANDAPGASEEPQRFDAGLREALKKFQSEHGLDADGLAGARTLIALSAVGPPAGTPTLHGPAVGVP